MPWTLRRFRNAQSVSMASYLGCRSAWRVAGLKIQSGSSDATISISGAMAVPTSSASAYRSGSSEMELEHTPTRSSSSRSQISAVEGEVAMILGSSSIPCTFAFAASTAAFSSGSVISNMVSTLSV